MNIHEYQAKEMFREFGVNVLEGVHCKSVDEAVEAYDSLESEIVAVKSQIHAGGRGKGYCRHRPGEEVMKGGVKIAFSRRCPRFSRTTMVTLVTKQTGPSGKIVTNIPESGCDIDHEFYLCHSG